MPFIKHNTELIEYQIIRRIQKNINITIKPDGSVYISAPQRTTTREVERILYSKIDWILKVRKELELKNRINNDYTFDSTSVICIYGQSKRLKVIPSDTNYLLIVDDEVLLHIKEKYIDNNDYKNRCIQKLLKRELFNTTMIYVNKYLKLMSLKLSEVDIRVMRSRWGTCIPSKSKIVINYNLIHCPKRSIEYIVLHEISHLKHANHSKKFYATIETYMSDWKDRKKILRNYAM